MKPPGISVCICVHLWLKFLAFLVRSSRLPMLQVGKTPILGTRRREVKVGKARLDLGNAPPPCVAHP